MDFELDEIQKSIQQTFKDFVDKKVKPAAAEIDENGEFPSALFRAVGKLGFFGMRYPEDCGGSGSDILSFDRRRGLPCASRGQDITGCCGSRAAKINVSQSYTYEK